MKAFIYLDPPYLNSFNGNYDQYNTSIDENKKIIDNTKFHLDILDYLKVSKCKILFSIHNNALTNYLYKDYVEQDYSNFYSSTQIRKDDDLKKFKK